MTDVHIELYKKYRPTTWKGLIGQEPVAKSLQTAVKSHKVPTAYLFSGPRGCGKTTSALVLAKAINCLNPVADTADPCNKCDVCVSIDNGTQVGVHYFSAAQRSGVEDMRELVQKARLSVPIKRQVFIIDEIHNLKQGKGFEALLIPLEEKGMPALFIFCTTEIEKVPQTIISRVQSRRFTLVESGLMLRYMKHVADKEGLDVTQEMLEDSVRQGRGSVRDTLTALESIVSTGEFSLSVGGKLLEALSKQDLTEALTVISQAIVDGQEGRDLADQLFEDLRNLLLSLSGVDSTLFGIVPVADEREVGNGLLGKKGIMLIMDEVGEAITQMSFGADSRIQLEICVIKSLGKLNRLKKAIAARNG